MPLSPVSIEEQNGPVKRAGWPTAAVAVIAERQRTLVTRRQLLALGIPARTITDAARLGRLHRVHRGVYSLIGARARPPWAPELAALLAVGDGAVLSHGSAARLHGLSVVRRSSAIDVTRVGAHRKPSHHGVIVHTATALPREDHHRRGDLAVTSVARTAIDLAPRLSDRQLEIVVDEALHRTSLTKLREALSRHDGRPGTPALRALLDPSRPSSLSWSQVEERLLQLIRRAGLPSPEINVELRPGYVPDLLWRRQRVIVEYVSDQWHSGPRSARRDDARINDTIVDGYRVLQITPAHAPEQVLVWIAQALALSDAG
jgi:hypothetical protein